MSEPLFEAQTMEIRDGPNALVRAVSRKGEVEGVQYLQVRDGEGAEIATVRRHDERGAVNKAGGRGTVARAANADDGRNVVTVTGPLDEQQRRVLAAFACSLVERRWTEIPRSPTIRGR